MAHNTAAGTVFREALSRVRPARRPTKAGFLWRNSSNLRVPSPDGREGERARRPSMRTTFNASPQLRKSAWRNVHRLAPTERISRTPFVLAMAIEKRVGGVVSPMLRRRGAVVEFMASVVETDAIPRMKACRKISSHVPVSRPPPPRRWARGPREFEKSRGKRSGRVQHVADSNRVAINCLI